MSTINLEAKGSATRTSSSIVASVSGVGATNTNSRSSINNSASQNGNELTQLLLKCKSLPQWAKSSIQRGYDHGMGKDKLLNLAYPLVI